MCVDVQQLWQYYVVKKVKTNLNVQLMVIYNFSLRSRFYSWTLFSYTYVLYMFLKRDLILLQELNPVLFLSCAHEAESRYNEITNM